MLRSKIKNQKSKINPSTQNLKILNFGLLFCILIFGCWFYLFAQQEFKYDSRGRRNPFIPLVTDDGRLLKFEEEEGASKNLSLEGIIYDRHGLSYACINGEIVKIGDKIGDYQVLKIEESKVVFIKDGQPQEVELKKEEE